MSVANGKIIYFYLCFVYIFQRLNVQHFSLLETKIKGLNMLNQLSWLIWSYKSYMFVSLFYVNARTKEKLIKAIVQYLKMLP